MTRVLAPHTRVGSRRDILVPAGTAILIVTLAIFVEVKLEWPRVLVQWAEDVPPDTRAALEQEYGLVDVRRGDSAPESLIQPPLDYRIVGVAPGATARMLNDPRLQVEGLDAQRSLDPDITIGWRLPRDARDVFQWQSAVTIAIALALLALSFVTAAGDRKLGAVFCLVVLTAAMVRQPLDQPIRMGDFNTYVVRRSNFEAYMAGERVRLEAHLSSMILRALDNTFGEDDRSPMRAFHALGTGASLWFGVMLGLAGWVLRWTPSALRYLALATLAPATLMFFGYRELAYLSLNPAAFPLVVVGLSRSNARFLTGVALFGVGGALHGFGLLSLSGTAALTLVAGRDAPARVARFLRACAVGASSYFVWILGYVSLMGLTMVPGHAERIPWRAFSIDRLEDHRINAALLSWGGGVETALAACVAGASLVLLALAAARARPRDAGYALAFALPSFAFLLLLWPVQGLAVEMDLIVAAFPAVYALAWLASRSVTLTAWAVTLLVVGHVFFWRVALGDFFVNQRVY